MNTVWRALLYEEALLILTGETANLRVVKAREWCSNFNKFLASPVFRLLWKSNKEERRYTTQSKERNNEKGTKCSKKTILTYKFRCHEISE